MADRAVAWNARVREQQGLTAVASAYTSKHGMTVAAGPFAGLTYPEAREAEVDAMPSKLSGLYEAELQPTIRSAIHWAPRTFVDIGTADGYYAVGFARASGAPTHGFEPSSRARRLCAEVAQLNGVELSLHRAATSTRLRLLDLRYAFVLSDCEGAEADIFDERAVDELGTALVVIEVHEWARPGVEDLLRARFKGSHDLTLIEERTPEPLRLDRGRWLVLRPKMVASMEEPRGARPT
jgi:hypothetical protein